MSTWLHRTLTSSIGRKVILALTGLGLIGFLVVHLAGNLTLYADRSGEAFDGYAHALESNPLLPVAEIGLLVLFAIHIGLALKLQFENREARTQRYAARANHGQKTAGSQSMLLTGLLVLGFLVLHLIDFRFASRAPEGLAHMVRETLSKPLHGIAYAAFMVMLTLHLSHGFQSAFQSLGANHPRYAPLLRKAGIGLAVVLGIGFASFPIVLIIQGPPK